jgi:hypothetical protein
MGERYFFILFLIFLAACQPYIQSTPTSQYQGTVATELSEENQTDSCATVACPSGQVCQEGKCGCPFGEKKCDNVCIDKKACCVDADCASKACNEGKCVPAPDCEFGETYKNGECQCAAGKVYCREQGKCIAKDGCCVHSQCDNFERCVETGWRTSLCAKVDEKKTCKIIAERKRLELFEIKGNEFRVNAIAWLSDGSVDFNVSNKTIRLAENITSEYGNVTLFQEGIEVIGGFCKEDEDE